MLQAILPLATIYALLTIVHHLAMRTIEKVYIHLLPKMWLKAVIK
jgi:hypothetical protein